MTKEKVMGQEESIAHEFIRRSIDDADPESLIHAEKDNAKLRDGVGHQNPLAAS